MIHFYGRKHMMHIKPNKGAVADVSDFSGTISTKERGFISLTKIVVTLSILLSILMIALR
jgi:hypothetical protein